MTKLQITKESDIPTNWNKFVGKKKTFVKTRPAFEPEEFAVSWSTTPLVSNPLVDIILISEDKKEYPCKMDIFDDTYEYVKNGNFAKKDTSLLFEIPEGIKCDIHTLESITKDVTFPFYVVIGKRGEPYSNSKEFVENNLTLTKV